MSVFFGELRSATPALLLHMAAGEGACYCTIKINSSKRLKGFRIGEVLFLPNPRRKKVGGTVSVLQPKCLKNVLRMP